MLKGCKHYGNKTIQKFENGGAVRAPGPMFGRPDPRIAAVKNAIGTGPSLRNPAGFTPRGRAEYGERIKTALGVKPAGLGGLLPQQKR